LLQQYNTLKQQLPGVALYYAIKAFPYPAIIEILDKAGACFDVASAGEIDLLQAQHISGRRTIHTHPIKKDAEIRAALRGGSTTFVVDNIDELKKLLPYRQRIGVLLRVSFRSETTQIDLSRKFGCSPDSVIELVEQASALGAHIRGLSFHVGSQSTLPKAHVEAIERCSQIINDAAAINPNPMDILDIGGGFPVSYNFEDMDNEAYFTPIREAIKQYVPDGIRVIAEPGRYLIAPAVTAISSVSGKAKRGDYQWYYLDDGVYGSYSGQIFDHACYPLQILNDEAQREVAILAGPTCDSIDIIAEDIELPKLEEGDLVIGHMMGAYTYATSTQFNSLSGASIIVI
ncbi:MAG: type III PLP-dependent enzyme, partial [Gammaproteobacteria bacterium]|nr:type III PLP-dependent enzyme [Gammaproteobacteria bacterium]